MKKVLFCVIIVWLFLAAMICPFTAAAFNPYESYSYDSRGNSVPSQAGYTAVRSVSGADLGAGSFDSPSDIFYDENGTFYIADTGNNRIVAVNGEFDGISGIYDSFVLSDGNETRLNEPSGIFVSLERNMMYIADSGNERVLVCRPDGSVVMEIKKPDSVVYDSTKTFIPRRVIADKAGNIYVLIGSITSGAAMFSPNGEFMGFYGANRAEPTMEVIVRSIRNIFSSEEKRSWRTRTVPSGISGFDINGDFIFTCTASSSQTIDRVKKLNAAGKNIFANKSAVFGDFAPSYGTSENQFIDVDISEDGFINCLDLTTGRFFQYDEECELIFIAGTKAGQLGGFSEVSAIESADNRICVLDSAKNTVTIFEETSFGETVHSAVTLFNDGYYEEALEPWFDVIRRDGNYRRAYVGAASALLNKGDYKSAMEYARAGYSPDIYNKAFAIWRETFVREHFGVIFMIFVIPAILYILRRKIYAHAVNMNTAAAGFLEKHGIYYGRRKKSPLRKSFFIVLMLFLAQIADGRLYGFQFGYPDDRTFSIIPYLVKSVIVFAAWVIGSRAVSTFLDGDGTAAKICISSAQALIPYIVQIFVCVALSHILVQDEVVFIQVIRIAGTSWTAVLLFLAVKNVHGYSPGRTLFSIILTVAAMLIMLFLLVLFMSLIQQMWVFVSSVLTEAAYRIRT